MKYLEASVSTCMSGNLIKSIKLSVQSALCGLGSHFLHKIQQSQNLSGTHNFLSGGRLEVNFPVISFVLHSHLVLLSDLFYIHILRIPDHRLISC